MELSEEDRAEFMAELGVEELVMPRILDRLLAGLGMIRFYTAGPPEARAWELPHGSDAVTAAGKIHTDLARGFIRAEVVACEDLMRAGDMRAAKAAGLVRVEGREYVVRDGDLVHVRFSV